MSERLLDLCDWNHRVASIAMFGASHTGAALENRDLWITHCGFPAQPFNCAFLKNPGERLPEAIETTERYFAGVDLPFCFNCRADHADRCAEALETAGYPRTVETPVMAMDPITAATKPVDGLEIHRVESAGDLADFQKTASLAFGFPEAAGPHFLTEELRAQPNVRFYLGRIDGQACCTSLVIATGGVAGIYWVATLDEQCGKGLGEEMTWAAVLGGRELGCGIANLQSSRSGYSVYARMGFETLTHYVRFEKPAP
ncbi:MAG: hypothetical protein E4H03_11605 [Myxococcales bacterium]|nr:MAG: hypothetical protein E4H03_11605 [Myxococcales bacterium]